jgi:hypothetical protein
MEGFKKQPHQKKEHEVLIIGDSHNRECAARVKGYLHNNFTVQGTVKPESRTYILV